MTLHWSPVVSFVLLLLSFLSDSFWFVFFAEMHKYSAFIDERSNM